MLTKSLVAVESFARFFLSQHETEIAIIFLFLFFYFFCYCDVQTAFRMRHFFDSTWFWEFIENWVLDCCCLLSNAPSCGWFLESRNYCPGLVNMSSKNRRDVVARGMEKLLFLIKDYEGIWFFLKWCAWSNIVLLTGVLDGAILSVRNKTQICMSVYF